MPLLSSYVLVKIANNDRNKVFAVPGIIRYVFWLGKPAVVRDQEIELMQNYLSGIYNEILISNIKEYKLHNTIRSFSGSRRKGSQFI